MDFYAILEVVPSSSADEIKTAYRRLTLRHHPDRNRNDPQAAERFHQVAKAWAVLGDANKRTKYDAQRAKGSEGSAKKNQRGLVDRLRKRGETIKLELPVKLSEMIAGGQRNVRFPKEEPCAACEGTGEHPRLDGPCGKCEGGGLIEVTANVTVKIRAGVKPGEELLFRSIGSYSSGKGLPGDVCAVVVPATGPGIELLGNSVRQTVAISVRQAQYGVEMRLVLPDGSTRNIKIPTGTQSGEAFILPGAGLINEKGGRGDYILRVGVVIPGPIGDVDEEPDTWAVERIIKTMAQEPRDLGTISK